MADPLLTAFDNAITQVARYALSSPSGEAIAESLERLAAELRMGRATAERDGVVDAGWLKRTIQETARWAPDDALPLLASLGAIARAATTR